MLGTLSPRSQILGLDILAESWTTTELDTRARFNGLEDLVKSYGISPVGL